MFELNSLLSGSGKSPETGVNGGMKDNSNSEKSPFGAILEANIADQEMAKSGNDAEQSGKEMPAFDYRTDLEKRTLSGGAELFLGGVEPSEEVIMDYARTQGLDAELVEILMAKSAVNKAEVVEDADTILDDLSSSGSPNTAPSSDLLSGSLSNISQNKSSLINDHSYLEVESPVTDKTKLGVSNQLGVKREDGVLTRLDTLAQKVSPDDNPEKMPLTQGNRRSAGDILTSKQNDFTANIPEELVEKLTTASSLRMHGAALVNSSSQMPSALLGENALPAKLNRAIAYTDLPSVKPQSSPVTAKNTVESTEITPLSKEIEGTSSQNNASTQESPSSRVVKSETVSVAVKNPVETAETKAPSKAVEVASPERTVSSQESPSSRVVKSEAVSVAVKNPVETAETKTPSKVAEVASPERSVSIKEGATSRVAKDDIAPTKSVAKLGSIPVTAKNSVETTEIKTPSKAVEVISPERTVSSQESASSRVVKSEPVPVAVKSPVETAETKAPSKAVEVASPERTVSSQESPSSRVVKSEPVSVAVKSPVETAETKAPSKAVEVASPERTVSSQESPSSRVVKSETVSVAVKNPVETAETKAPSKAVEVASPERTVSSQESPSSRVVKSEAVSVAVKNPVETAETKTPSKVAEVASPERSVSIKEGATSRVAKGDIAPTKSLAKLGSIPVTAKNSVETTEIKTPAKAVEVISPERTVSSQESASSRVVKSEPVPVAVKSPVETAETKAPSKAVEVASPERTVSSQESPSSRVVKSEPVSVAVKSPVETAETKAPSKAVEVASPERSASPQKTAVSRAVKEVPFGLDAQNKGNINSATVKARELDRAMPVSVSTLKPETTEVKPPEIKPEMRTQSDKGIDTSHKVPVGPRSVDKQTALEANANRPVPEVIRVAMPISVAKNMTSAETKNTRVIKLAPIDLAAFANTVEKVSLPYKRSSVIEENNFTKERSSEATALGTNGRVSLSEKGTTEQILNSSGQDNLRRQDQYLELSQRLTDALSRRLAAQIKQGSWHVEIELHPRSLGRIEVQLEMKNGELEAHFNASRALTRDLIQEGLPRLKAELEQHGTESAYVGVGHQNQGRSDENPTDSDGDSNSSGHETDSKADQNTKNQKANNIEGLDIQV